MKEKLKILWSEEEYNNFMEEMGDVIDVVGFYSETVVLQNCITKNKITLRYIVKDVIKHVQEPESVPESVPVPVVQDNSELMLKLDKINDRMVDIDSMIQLHIDKFDRIEKNVLKLEKHNELQIKESKPTAQDIVEEAVDEKIAVDVEVMEKPKSVPEEEKEDVSKGIDKDGISPCCESTLSIAKERKLKDVKVQCVKCKTVHQV